VPLSVVVPTIGRVDLQGRCLRSIQACDPPPAEMIVVDQSGGDEIRTLAEGLGVRVLASWERGIPTGTNLGLAQATYATVLVTDDDCTVASDWVATAYRLAGEYPGAILTGLVLPPDGSGYVPSTICATGAHDYTGTITSGALYPANMMVDRDALSTVGGFDERAGLRVAAEDNDLCPDDQERSEHVQLVEQSHQLGGEARVRPIVEGQGHCAGVGIQRSPHPGHAVDCPPRATEYRGARRRGRAACRHEPR